MEIENGKLIIGGRSSIKIVNTETYQVEESVLNTKMENVLSFIQLTDNLIICGCSKGMLWKYDVDTKEVSLFNTETHKESIDSLVKIDNKSFITCYDMTITKWNI